MNFKLTNYCSRMLPLLLCLGCSGSEYQIASVTGSVTCEGKPVVKAIVYFEPLKSGKSALIGKQGFALTDENGKFSVSTYGESDGAVVGKHLVRVGRSESSSECNCVLAAEVPLLEVEVKSGEANEFSFALAKATLQQKRREAAIIKANAED
jgi:hypothetical protein